jgi:hypothetical protein
MALRHGAALPLFIGAFNHATMPRYAEFDKMGFG